MNSTNTHKTAKAAFIEDLEKMDALSLEEALERNCQEESVDTINWPDAFPYCPECRFRVARSSKYLAVSFHVKGKDLRATELGDNGRNWEDSCCEFFISPDAESYFNIEINCIGSVLMAKGKGRDGRVKVQEKDVARIIRHCSLEHKLYDCKGDLHCWQVAVVIPFDLIGLNPDKLPESVNVNFYKCGDLTATPHFVSWNPIDTPNPDFHRPEFFGKLLLNA